MSASSMYQHLRGIKNEWQSESQLFRLLMCRVFAGDESAALQVIKLAGQSEVE